MIRFARRGSLSSSSSMPWLLKPRRFATSTKPRLSTFVVPAPATIAATATANNNRVLVGAFTNGGRFSFKNAPLFWGTLIATAKTSLADLLVQTQIEGKSWSEIDWRRNFVFLTFGFGYLGLGMYGVYVKGFGRMFGQSRMKAFCDKSIRDKLRDTAGLRMLSTQVFLDVAVLNPLCYWPAYYAFKALSFAQADDKRTSGQIVYDTVFVEYPKTFVEDNSGMGLFWVPANFVIYAVPLHLRLPLNHSVSLLWCCILSLWRGGENSTADLPSSAGNHQPSMQPVGKSTWQMA